MEMELVEKAERLRYAMVEYGAEMIQGLMVLVFGLILLQFVMRRLRVLMDKYAKDRTRATTILGIIYILALVDLY